MSDDVIYDGYEWDERKSQRCLDERGFDFSLAAELFDTSVAWVRSSRQDHGEPRFESIGEVAGIKLFVVWTPRNGRRRIISARLASREERYEYLKRERE